MVAANVRQPTIPRQVQTINTVNLTQGSDIRGVVADTIDQMVVAGGGRVIIPPGNWLVNGPIHLQSGIDLHVSEGATLRFGTNPADYLPVVLTRWEGTDVYNYSPLIYARKANDVAITGTGRIDGQGRKGFFRWRPEQKPSQSRLRQMGATGVPIEERIFGEGYLLRPGFVQFHECERVLVDGPTFVDPTFWMIHPVYCNHVTIRNVTLRGTQLNSDGIDPDSCEDVLIENCTFDVNDDCVAIKSGRDADGRRVGRPTRRVLVRNCDMRTQTAAGVGIGSEMSGGASDIFAENLRISRADYALYFKANKDRGGVVDGVYARNLVVSDCDKLIHLTTDYKKESSGNMPPVFRNFDIAEITCRNAGTGIEIVGLPEMPVKKIALSNIAITSATRAAIIEYADEIQATNVMINGKAWQP
ncbi:exopolygalacturonase PelB [Parasphingorhabdus litoris]|uniref:Exopolygalacturonase PelB n=2 Tax=Parasphingorhabdus litoris TaxID=394733 RepID=A0ABN1AUG6_9SPHN